MFAADSAFWWYASRASGIVLWLLVAFAVMWGFAVSSRLVRKRASRHGCSTCTGTSARSRWCSPWLHLASLWADSFVEFGWRELFVPMASTWKPGAVAWGIVALYCLVLVQSHVAAHAAAAAASCGTRSTC